SGLLDTGGIADEGQDVHRQRQNADDEHDATNLLLQGCTRMTEVFRAKIVTILSAYRSARLPRDGPWQVSAVMGSSRSSSTRRAPLCHKNARYGKTAPLSSSLPINLG